MRNAVTHNTKNQNMFENLSKLPKKKKKKKKKKTFFRKRFNKNLRTLTSSQQGAFSKKTQGTRATETTEVCFGTNAERTRRVGTSEDPRSAEGFSSLLLGFAYAKLQKHQT